MESLENLKVGDKIFYDGGYGRIGIVTISRLTSKQIIIKDGRKFWKDGGRIVGAGSHYWSILRLLTPERIEKVELVNLKEKAIYLRSKLAIPQDKKTLEKLIIALKPFVKDKP